MAPNMVYMSAVCLAAFQTSQAFLIPSSFSLPGLQKESSDRHSNNDVVNTLPIPKEDQRERMKNLHLGVSNPMPFSISDDDSIDEINQKMKHYFGSVCKKLRHKAEKLGDNAPELQLDELDSKILQWWRDSVPTEEVEAEWHNIKSDFKDSVSDIKHIDWSQYIPTKDEIKSGAQDVESDLEDIHWFKYIPTKEDIKSGASSVKSDMKEFASDLEDIDWSKYVPTKEDIKSGAEDVKSDMKEFASDLEDIDWSKYVPTKEDIKSGAEDVKSDMKELASDLEDVDWSKDDPTDKIKAEWNNVESNMKDLESDLKDIDWSRLVPVDFQGSADAEEDHVHIHGDADVDDPKAIMGTFEEILNDPDLFVYDPLNNEWVSMKDFKAPEESPEWPGTYRHSPHSGGRRRCNGSKFRRVMRAVGSGIRTFVTGFLIPVLIGVAAGMTASLFGMLIGTLCGWLWVKLVHGGRRRAADDEAAEYMYAGSGTGEKDVLLTVESVESVDEAPPVYVEKE